MTVVSSIEIRYRTNTSQSHEHANNVMAPGVRIRIWMVLWLAFTWILSWKQRHFSTAQVRWIANKSGEIRVTTEEQALENKLSQSHVSYLKSLINNPNAHWTEPWPWHIWKFKSESDKTRYIVFSVQNLYKIPGISSVSIHLLSETGDIIDSWNFSTGWRMDVQSASMSYDEHLQTPLITISTTPVMGGRDVAKQYFAMVEDQIYLIRLEDSHGKLIRNIYKYSNKTLGGELPAKDVGGWVALLNSPKLPLRLAALTYCSGIHAKLSRRVNMAHEFRNLKTTKREIESYLDSDNPWEKEASDLAAKPDDYLY